eukprot:1171629-Prymnesium_polylepis.1
MPATRTRRSVARWPERPRTDRPRTERPAGPTHRAGHGGEARAVDTGRRVGRGAEARDSRSGGSGREGRGSGARRRGGAARPSSNGADVRACDERRSSDTPREGRRNGGRD